MRWPWNDDDDEDNIGIDIYNNNTGNNRISQDAFLSGDGAGYGSNFWGAKPASYSKADWWNDNTMSNTKYSNLNYKKMPGKDGKIGWNTGTLEGVGSVMGGLGSLAQAWAGLQNVKLGKQELASQKEQWNKNYASQATTVNNQIANQNAWKTAQGRSDMGNLVKTYLG